MKKYVIIVAGGSGTRMNNAVPKQFIYLQGKPILMHTIELFHTVIPDINIIVVLAKQYNEEWHKLCDKHQFRIPYQTVYGGETRFNSVKHGLMLVPNNCIVAVHDASRPFASAHTITHAFNVAEEKGNAIPAIAMNESLREIKGNDNKAVDRDNYVIIQTPQCFKSHLLKEAFSQDYKPSYTDDASVVESIGEKINLIEGNRENIKITTSEDLAVAEAMIKVL